MGGLVLGLAVKEMRLHTSDCAVFNMPAMPPDPCDCGAADHNANLQGMIYSPEASDDHPLGDWQTKLAIALFVLVVVGLVIWIWP